MNYSISVFCIAVTLFCLPLVPLAQEQEDTTGIDTIKSPSKDTVYNNKNIEKTVDKTLREDAPEKNDTIYLFEDKEKHVNVLKITYDSILYREPGTTRSKSINKDKVNKIRYSWGRLEILNEHPPKYPGPYDWRKVKILKNQKAAEDLIKVREVEARIQGSSRGYDSPESLEARAKVVLRKKAANVNARFVLITSKNINIAFGELPTATFKGIAYTNEESAQNEEKNK